MPGRHKSRPNDPGVCASPNMLAEQRSPRLSRRRERRVGRAHAQVFFRVANDDDGGRTGGAPNPGGKHCEAQSQQRRDRRQPDRRQERPALKARVILFHATMITMKTGALPRLPVIILAAGFSSRLGRPKALARVRSRQSAAQDPYPAWRDGPPRRSWWSRRPALRATGSRRAACTCAICRQSAARRRPVEFSAPWTGRGALLACRPVAAGGSGRTAVDATCRGWFRAGAAHGGA